MEQILVKYVMWNTLPLAMCGVAHILRTLDSLSYFYPIANDIALYIYIFIMKLTRV